MLPPLVERELRIALHRNVRRQWLAAIWTAGGITLFFLFVIGVTGSRSAGRTLFHWLFALGCLGVVTRGFGLTADLFSEERRQGTLGLLVLTGLRPLEIFSHKLLGAAWLALYSLLGALPFFALPFLTGGVLPREFLCALVFLINALLLCVSLGLLASVLHSEGGQAHLTGLALAAFLCLATPAANWIVREFGSSAGLAEDWLALSPAYAAYLVFTGFGGGSFAAFWTSSGLALAASLTALLLAAAILNRTWRDGPKDSAASPGWWREWKNPAGQTAFARAQRLGRNPFGWMVARRRGPVLLARVLVVTLALVWFGGWLLRGSSWVNPGMGFLCATLLHVGLIWILACAAGRQLAEDRQTGGLEVLLTTPLSVEGLLDGQLRALGRPFREVFVATVALDLAFFCGSFGFGRWEAAGLIAYGCLWALLLLVSFAFYREALARSLWISVWTGRPIYAATQATWQHLVALVAFSLVTRGWLVSFPFSRMSAPIVFLVLFLGVIASAVSFNRTYLCWTKLRTELRLIACARIPARGDKRFAKWVPELIHPPGRWGELELRPGKTTRSWFFGSRFKRRRRRQRSLAARRGQERP